MRQEIESDEHGHARKDALKVLFKSRGALRVVECPQIAIDDFNLANRSAVERDGDCHNRRYHCGGARPAGWKFGDGRADALRALTFTFNVDLTLNVAKITLQSKG